MKKVISTLTMLAIILFASCDSDKKDPEFYSPVKNISVAGLDSKTEEIKRDQMTVHVESEFQLVIAFNPGYASDIADFTFKYSSSDETVATIDANGKIKTGTTTADKPKETLITVTPVNKPEMKFEFTLVLIKKDIVSLSTKTDYSKGMFIRAAVENKESGELEIGELVFTPTDASIQKVEYKCADESIAKAQLISIPDGEDADGKAKFKEVWGVKAIKVGTTKLTITPTDNPAAKYEIDVNVIDSYLLDKSVWIVDLVFPNLEPAKVNKANLIDAKKDTYMTLAKPGQQGVEKDAKLSISINRGNSEEFNAIQVTHTGDKVSERVLAVSLYGRKDILVDWTPIQENIKIKDADKKDILESPMIELEKASDFQFVRVDITEWDEKEGATETLKIAELDFIGYK